MKNPWMSAWLSAANTMGAAGRGQMAAEMSRQQTAMMQAWTEAWMAFWFPWLPWERKRRR